MWQYVPDLSGSGKGPVIIRYVWKSNATSDNRRRAWFRDLLRYYWRNSSPTGGYLRELLNLDYIYFYLPIFLRRNSWISTKGSCICMWVLLEILFILILFKHLVNKTNLVHNLFLVWYAGRTLHTRQSSTKNNKYQVSHKHSCFSWWWAHSRPKHVEIDKWTKNKYTKNKLRTKLALFTRLYRDARSTQHKISFKQFFRRVREIAKSYYYLRHVCLSIRSTFCLSVHPHGTTWLPLNEF